MKRNFSLFLKKQYIGSVKKEMLFKSKLEFYIKFLTQFFQLKDVLPFKSCVRQDKCII